MLVLAVSYRGIYDDNLLAYLNKYKVKTNTEHNKIKFKIDSTLHIRITLKQLHEITFYEQNQN